MAYSRLLQSVYMRMAFGNRNVQSAWVKAYWTESRAPIQVSSYDNREQSARCEGGPRYDPGSSSDSLA